MPAHPVGPLVRDVVASPRAGVPHSGTYESIHLDQLQHLPIQLVALPVFVLDIAAPRIERAEVAAEVPQGPAPAGLFPQLEVVLHPRQRDVVRRAVVAAPFADVYAAALG